MSFQHITAGSAEAHTWEGRPEYRMGNHGAGMCNTGSGKRVICAFNGIGCDVDHVEIACANFRAAMKGWGELMDAIRTAVDENSGPL